MYTWIGLGLISLLLETPAQAPAAERKVVEYLKANVKPGQPVIVSRLYNDVFKTPEERKVLDRLFNTFFKIPMFLVQYNAASKKIPTLREVSEQFHLTVPGEADVLLRIMEIDPRIPKFIERNPRTGEITKIDITRIQASPQFGRVIERSITGWKGKPAPFFSASSYAGQPVSSQQVAGQPHVVYFWFTSCPPCMRIAPLLVELHNKYASKGLKIIAANADKVLELPYNDKVRADYVRNTGIKFTTATMNAQMQQVFGGVSVFPTMFFVDRRGLIVEHFVNFQDKPKLEAAILDALK
jgi:thiol-disulfide isomerase/thioredoxin